MSALSDKKIILSITGSIAAYKSALLTRLLIKAGSEVKVLMTSSAMDFITPLTFSTLSKNPVFADVSDGENWNNHVDVGLWADAFLVAPATATTLGKMAHGIADNMVVATYLSAKCPVFVAPAMDLDMWKHPSTQHNIDKLQSYGNEVIPVGHGELASGLTGEGRMAEPEEIIQYLENHFGKKKDLTGRKVLITAGPTYEALDPVRFIGNHSSGKMGAALAEECAFRGAKVSLILGPSQVRVNHPDIDINRVTTADDMFEAASSAFKGADIIIMAAAVADFKPERISDKKIKKTGNELHLSLVKTRDIAADLGRHKRPDQIMVGFALETNDEISNAKGKLQKKNFDFIVLNSLNDEGAGFQLDTNKITILTNTDEQLEFKVKSKRKVAVDIVDKIVGIKSL